ncbi:MAG: AMP-binding protein [Azospirillaceae bacterium]
MTDSHYDALETRSADAREADLMARLRDQIAHAKANAPGHARRLADVDPETVTDRAALARLPLLRKADLPDAQAARPPFAGLAAVKPGAGLRRIFASPGPIYDAEGEGPDYWRTARALWATGIRKGDIVQNCFAYHFTPAGVMFDCGAEAIGAAVVPAGVGNTEQQARAIADIRPRAYVGTPDFLKAILEKADALGLPSGSLRLAHVSGGPLFPELKDFYAGRDIAVMQSYGTADIGLIAYETAARDGLVLDEHIIVEIVRPGTGDPLPDGEVGEVVVTTFSRAYPLIRFATGDLSAIAPGQSATGHTAPLLRGWMGRADQTTKVKGMFVHPRQVAEIVSRHPGIARARLTVTAASGVDSMTLAVESDRAPDGAAEAIAATLQSVTKLRGVVELVAPGSLPNDGKVIDDRRKDAGMSK